MELVATDTFVQLCYERRGLQEAYDQAWSDLYDAEVNYSYAVWTYDDIQDIYPDEIPTAKAALEAAQQHCMELERQLEDLDYRICAAS